MKRILWLFLFSLLVTGVQAQSNSEVAIRVLPENMTTEWNQLSIIDGIIFSAKTVECSASSSRILFMVENTSDKRYIIEWEFLEKWTNSDGSDSLMVEPRDILISANETREGSCNLNSDYYYLLTLDLRIAGAVLSEVSFSKLKITEYEIR